MANGANINIRFRRELDKTDQALNFQMEQILLLQKIHNLRENTHRALNDLLKLSDDHPQEIFPLVRSSILSYPKVSTPNFPKSRFLTFRKDGDAKDRNCLFLAYRCYKITNFLLLFGVSLLG